jgi:phage gp29-like protein
MPEQEDKKELKPKRGAVTAVDRDAMAAETYGLKISRKENPNDFFGKGRTDCIQQIVKEMEESDPILPGIFRVVESVLGFPRIIEGKGQVADLIREQFADIENFYIILSHYLDAIKFGFSPVEFVWKQNGPYWWWDKILDWSMSNFEFSENNELMLRLDNGEFRNVDEKTKFKTITWKMKYGNRYGNSDYHKLYYHSLFTSDNFLWWGIFNERFASPHPVISPDSDSSGRFSTEDHNAAVEFLKHMRNMTGLVLDMKAAVELLEAKASSGDNYDKFTMHMNRTKSMLLTGNPETAEVIQRGSLAREKEMTLLRRDIQETYINWLETFVNDVMIRMWLNVNFPNIKREDVPKWRIKVPKRAEDEEKFVNSRIKAAGSGVKIGVGYMGGMLGVPEPEDGEELLQGEEKQEPVEQNFAYNQYAAAKKIYDEDVAALRGK